jgi:RHS repeat-associated protein
VHSAEHGSFKTRVYGRLGHWGGNETTSQNYPFGEQLGIGVGIRSADLGYGGDSVRQKFTGYEKDDETGLDFAQARYYGSIQGRFTSPDTPGENHTAIFLNWDEQSGVQGMRVIQQMSDPYGVADFGFIPFNSNNEYYQNAYRFSCVQIPK